VCLRDPEAVPRALSQRQADRRRHPIEGLGHQGRVCFRAESTADPRARKRAGYSAFVEDRGGAGYGALQEQWQLQGAVMKAPGMGFPFSSYQSNVPSSM